VVRSLVREVTLYVNLSEEELAGVRQPSGYMSAPSGYLAYRVDFGVSCWLFRIKLLAVYQVCFRPCTRKTVITTNTVVITVRDRYYHQHAPPTKLCLNTT